MNRKISRLQMAVVSLIKELQALISVRIPLEILPTKGKLKFNNNNSDSKSIYSNSSGNNNNNNNEYKYIYNDDNNDDDDDDINSNKNNNNDNIKVMIKIKFYLLKFLQNQLFTVLSERSGSHDIAKFIPNR